MATIDLDVYAASCIETAAYGMSVLDLDTLRDEAQDAIGNEAENACTYTYMEDEILRRYDIEVLNSDIDELTSGKQYAATSWREAKTAYAAAIAYLVISEKVQEKLDEIEQAYIDLNCMAREYGAPESLEDQKPAIQSGNTLLDHYAPSHIHADVFVWNDGQADGSNAVAIKSGGVWLSYVWQPAVATA